MSLTSIDHIADVERFGNQSDGPLDLLIEVPHGATAHDDFAHIAEQLQGSIPVNLEHFYYVNTDVGAYELGLLTAQRLASRHPELRIMLIRARIPRTFVDVNRLLDVQGGALQQGGVTAGIPPFFHHPQDLELFHGLYKQYRELVDAAWASLAPQGLGLTPHTYAPRTVGISQIDAKIVENLRHAWHPEVAPTWPLRPEVDLITTDPTGADLSPLAVVAAFVAGLKAMGRQVALNESYNLHPATMGAFRAQALPGRVLCLEVRRDLLVEDWDPFTVMRVSSQKVQPFADVLSDALGATLFAASGV